MNKTAKKLDKWNDVSWLRSKIERLQTEVNTLVRDVDYYKNLAHENLYWKR